MAHYCIYKTPASTFFFFVSFFQLQWNNFLLLFKDSSFHMGSESLSFSASHRFFFFKHHKTIPLQWHNAAHRNSLFSLILKQLSLDVYVLHSSSQSKCSQELSILSSPSSPSINSSNHLIWLLHPPDHKNCDCQGYQGQKLTVTYPSL